MANRRKRYGSASNPSRTTNIRARTPATRASGAAHPNPKTQLPSMPMQFMTEPQANTHVQGTGRLRTTQQPGANKSRRRTLGNQRYG